MFQNVSIKNSYHILTLDEYLSTSYSKTASTINLDGDHIWFVIDQIINFIKEETHELNYIFNI